MIFLTKDFKSLSNRSLISSACISLIAILISVTTSGAQAPRKSPLTKYRQLWEKSLVTEKPPPPESNAEELPNELDDFVLGGWTQTAQGYLVSLINSKNPQNRVTIAPGMPNSGGYQVLEVKRDPLNYKSSQVLIQYGSDKKWIGYEDKFLTLQQPPAVQQSRNQAAQRAAQQQAQQNAQQRNGRQNRNQQANSSQAGQTPPNPLPNLNNPQGQQRNPNSPPIPTGVGGANTNNSNGNQQQPASRTPRVRRVPVPPRR